MVKKKRKQWISATINSDNYWAIKQKSMELYGGNFSEALDHIISVYRSVWTDLMLARLRTDVLDAYLRMKFLAEKNTE